MMLRMWMRSVRVKKKHHVNMQKIQNVLMSWGLDGFKSEGSSEATRLKVVQLDKTSNVRTKKMGLVKSLASSTITGIVTTLNQSNPVSKRQDIHKVCQIIPQSQSLWIDFFF